MNQHLQRLNHADSAALQEAALIQSRRSFFQQAGMGVGGMALDVTGE
ncbi:MAG: hypothetical protein R3C11_10350 [Planctomycetaceae bacterium]